MPRVDEINGSDVGGVGRAVNALRTLIATRKLLPGEQLRQDELALITETSRGTLREALQVLAMEKMVTYNRNRGYTVAKFEPDEMQQMYELRDFVERRLLESLPPLTEKDLEELHELNEQIKASLDDPHAVVRLNDEFHLKIFSHSPLKVMIGEVTRWWNMSAAYRALSVSTSPNRALIPADHDQMIEALRARDKQRLLAVASDHREDSLQRIMPAIS